MRARRWLPILLLACLTLSGCWDHVSIEDEVYPHTLAIDAMDEDLLFSIEVPQTQRVPTGMHTGGRPEATRLASPLLSARAKNLVQALQVLNSGVLRMVSLKQIRSVVISEEVAREGIEGILEELIRSVDVRRGVAIVVARGSAREVISTIAPVAEMYPALAESVILTAKRLHMYPPIRLQQVIARLETSGSDPFVPLAAVNRQSLGSPEDLPPWVGTSLKAGEFPRTGGSPVEHAGTAIFRRDRLVGTITVDETAALLALRGEMGKVYASIPDPLDPGHVITLRYHQENKPRYRASLRASRPVVSVHLQFEGEILGSPGKADYTKPENRRILERHVARMAETTNFATLIAKVYREWGADPAGFGHLFRSKFPTIDDWLGYNWPSHVKDLEVSVTTDMYIRRYGLLFGPVMPSQEGR